MKAITPVISLVMLLLITVSLVGITYAFISGTLNGKIYNAFSVIYSSQNSVMIRNDGTQPITSFTATLDGNPENVVTMPNVSGLVAYWSFNEGTGNVAKDSQGNTNLDILNLVTWVSGKFGTGVKIDPSISASCTNQNAGVFTNSIPSSIQSLPQGPFTQVWWNYLPTTSNGETLVHLPSANVPGCGTCSIWNIVGHVWVATTGGVDSSIWYTPPSINIWHQMAYVFDKPNLQHKIYIDGQLVASAPLVNGDYGTVQWLSVGVYRPDCTDATPGAIYDDYQIYNRALSMNEINILYSNSIGPGKVATLKTITSLPTGKHNLVLCTASSCNTVTLTIA